MGYELHPQYLAGDVLDLLQVFGELHPAAFAPAAGMNLGLDNVPARAGLLAQLLGGGYGFLGRVGREAFLHAHAVLFENFLALILVNVHRRG